MSQAPEPKAPPPERNPTEGGSYLRDPVTGELIPQRIPETPQE